MATNYNIGKKIEGNEAEEILFAGKYEAIDDTVIGGKMYFANYIHLGGQRYIALYDMPEPEQAEDIDLDDWLDDHLVGVYAEVA